MEICLEILSNSILFSVLYRLLSSARLLKKHCVRNNKRSFKNKSNNSGPSIDSCETPVVTFFVN